MNRRALLAAIAATNTSAVASCVGDDTGAEGNNDDDDGSHGNSESEDGERSRDGNETAYQPLCDDPAYVLDEDDRTERFDYATWQMWAGIGPASASMSRMVSGDVESKEWTVGETIARDDEILEIRTEDGTLVMEPTYGGGRREFEVDEELFFRHDYWKVEEAGEETVVLELLDQPESLKISWEHGEFRNLDGDIYVVDIEPESQVSLCLLEDIDAAG